MIRWNSSVKPVSRPAAEVKVISPKIGAPSIS